MPKGIDLEGAWEKFNGCHFIGVEGEAFKIFLREQQAIINGDMIPRPNYEEALKEIVSIIEDDFIDSRLSYIKITAKAILKSLGIEESKGNKQ